MDNQEFQKIVLEELKSIKQDTSSLKQDVTGLKQDVTGLKQDVKIVKQDITNLKQDVTDLKQDNVILKNQMDENTQMLKALIHASEVHKADIDKLTFDVAHVQGNIVALRKDLTTVERVTASNYTDIIELKSIKK